MILLLEAKKEMMAITGSIKYKHEMKEASLREIALGS